MWQRQGFSLIDQKLTKLQPSENGLNLRFRASEGTLWNPIVY